MQQLYKRVPQAGEVLVHCIPVLYMYGRSLQSMHLYRYGTEFYNRVQLG